MIEQTNVALENVVHDVTFSAQSLDEIGEQRCLAPECEQRCFDEHHIHLAKTPLAEVGEPKAALPVEHEIVRPAQAVLAAFVDDGLDLAGLEVDALDRPGGKAANIVRQAP